MDIAGKVAVVTGAGGGGQGRAVALRLAAEGAAVVVSDIDENGGQETVRRVQGQGGRAAMCRADVGCEADVRALIAYAEREFGGVDILVNNAGPYFPEDPLQRWEETLRANLMGTVWGVLHAIEPMARRGGGAIVCYGSTSAVGHGLKHCPSPAYDVAKAGVARLATTMAGFAGSHGVRVNCIVPDWVATEELQAYVASLTPEQRRAGDVPDSLTTLDEIADAVMRLIRDEALSGRVLVWWSGRKPGLIPLKDPGYSALEPF